MSWYERLWPHIFKEEAEEEKKLNSPPHYTLPDGSDSMATIEKLLTAEEYKGFIKGNIFKYVIRHEKKGGLKDLYKAEDYLLRLMDFNNHLDDKNE